MPMKNIPTIIIIDDEKGLRDILTKVLVEDGYIVFSAASGEEAIEFIRAKPVDLSLVDLKMPGIDGIETVRRIKEINGSIINVIITAYGQMESVKEATELGVYDYITKPFDLEYVRALVKHLLIDTRPEALPFAGDLEKTLTGELTQRQAQEKKIGLLKEQAQAMSEAIKFTVKRLDDRIVNMYGSFTDSVIYKARMIMDTAYFRIILVCVIVGAVFGYFYTAWLTRQLSQPKVMERRQKITTEDLYGKIENIEKRQLETDMLIRKKFFRENE